MFELIRPGTNFDFVGKSKLCLGLSAICMLATAVLFFTKGLNYGIDFTGGAEIQVKIPADWGIGKLRGHLQDGGVKDARVVQIGAESEGQFLIKVQGDEKSLNATSDKIEGIIGKTLQKGQYEMQRVDVVGPAAGESLRQSGFLSMLYALISILIYVTIRFDSRYSPGAVIALLHDTTITAGVFILTQKQFDLQILAALLALIGYSNNDTIIVFDRVRETMGLFPGLTVEQAVNRAVNETLGRTLLTVLSTLISILALWLFGGPVIHDFAFTLLVGMIVGTYSSIFIASALVIVMTNYFERKEASARRGGGKRKEYKVRAEPKFQPE